MSKGVRSKCIDCVPPERYAGCHDKCPHYLAYKEQQDNNKQPEGDSDYFDYLRNAVRRMKRNNRW